MVEEFNRLIGQRIKEQLPVQTVWAVCKSVDWEKKVMIATGQTDELDYEDVSLGRGWEYKKPVVGSICLLGIEENNPANAYLLDADAVEEMAVKIGTSELTITPQGFRLNRGGQNAFKCLSDMIDEINKIIVINGTTINVAAMNAIKERLNNVLIE